MPSAAWLRVSCCVTSSGRMATSGSSDNAAWGVGAGDVGRGTGSGEQWRICQAHAQLSSAPKSVQRKNIPSAGRIGQTQSGARAATANEVRTITARSSREPRLRTTARISPSEWRPRRLPPTRRSAAVSAGSKGFCQRPGEPPRDDHQRGRAEQTQHDGRRVARKIRRHQRGGAAGQVDRPFTAHGCTLATVGWRTTGLAPSEPKPDGWQNSKNCQGINGGNHQCPQDDVARIQPVEVPIVKSRDVKSGSRNRRIGVEVFVRKLNNTTTVWSVGCVVEEYDMSTPRGDVAIVRDRYVMVPRVKIADAGGEQ